ncbi:MAG TPA: 2-dehydropantoate 2-reductase N-terminal domain-containing protein [Myxococcales bacterium]|nr:2-dehydropantoate 2-reductase N-terminal domain-containing protein [Myxococcales bacterium]
MRALVVGAGAVGQVLARHLALGGAEVAFLVKPSHADELARPLAFYPLNGRRGLAHLAGVGVLTAPGQAAGSPWDQVYLGVASTGLRDGAWLAELGAATGAATVVALQPGLGDGELILAAVDPARVVFGVTSFLSWHAPLPGQAPLPEPGFAYWFPPLGKSPFSGPAERAAAVVAALRAGGLPSRVVPDARRLSVVPSAVFTGCIAALEAAGWTFAGLRRDGWLARGCAAGREAVAIGARAAGAGAARLARLLLRPLVARLVLRLAPHVVPFDLETYTRVHFRKVGGQTPLAFEEYVAAGQRLGLPTAALRALAADVAAARAG